MLYLTDVTPAAAHAWQALLDVLDVAVPLGLLPSMIAGRESRSMRVEPRSGRVAISICRPSDSMNSRVCSTSAAVQ